MKPSWGQYFCRRLAKFMQNPMYSNCVELRCLSSKIVPRAKPNRMRGGKSNTGTSSEDLVSTLLNESFKCQSLLHRPDSKRKGRSLVFASLVQIYIAPSPRNLT